MNNDIANVAHFDRYTVGHALLGVLAARAGMRLSTTTLLAVGWELVEDQLKVALPAVFPRASPDSKVNALTDVLAVVLGHMAADAARKV